MRKSTIQLDWHAVEASRLLAELDTTGHGLTSSEAQIRLQEVGLNRLPERKPPAWWQVFGRQFHNPLIYILAVAGAVSAGVGEFTDAAFILGVLLLNGGIGSFQEWRAERSSLALQKLIRTRATVTRDRETREIDAEQVVPGDVVWLESGNRVPADVRLLSAHGLEVDESLLTGESLPVFKDAAWVGAPLTSVGDRLNMAYAGSIVSRGRGHGLVVATRTNTVVGCLALEVTTAAAGRPPLILRLDRFTKVIGAAVLCAALVVALVGILWQNQPVAQMFLFAVALAVSAIPEGLPVALTVALAVATNRMARRGVIVRRLAAVEGLGSCTLIATDKTGTLTCNELTVRRAFVPERSDYQVTGEGYAPVGEIRKDGKPVEPGEDPELERLVRAAALCNEAHLHPKDEHWHWRGDPTDVALLSFSAKLGCSRESLLEKYPQRNQIPFEPERKFAASYHLVDGATTVFVKGAPERVLEMCREPMSSEQLAAAAENLAESGFRVLAFAEGELSETPDAHVVPPEPTELTFLGFVGMIDPPRAGVREAISSCRLAGIDVTMITGDHPVTALAIARDLDLAFSPDQVATGTALTQVQPDELKQLLKRVRVFARVSPQQKLEIVNAARAQGHFVAVTGDGVNDAPALRAANIGVAMGKGGTDVAREAAELVVSDDNFATIVSGVEEGRVAYANVRKVIYLLISTGAAEVVLVTLALAAGLPLPLLPVQLLWLNLVTNGIQDVALAFEPREGDILRCAPRSPKELIFNRLMIERTLVGALVMGIVGFATFKWMIDVGYDESRARNCLLLLMVLFENVHIGNCRSETTSMLRLSPLRSPILLTGTLLAFSLHFTTLHFPMAQQVLQTQPVDLRQWLTLILLALSVAVAMEVHKLTWSLRQRSST